MIVYVMVLVGLDYRGEEIFDEFCVSALVFHFSTRGLGGQVSLQIVADDF